MTQLPETADCLNPKRLSQHSKHSANERNPPSTLTCSGNAPPFALEHVASNSALTWVGLRQEKQQLMA
jgi:hypothetical protein